MALCMHFQLTCSIEAHAGRSCERRPLAQVSDLAPSCTTAAAWTAFVLSHDRVFQLEGDMFEELCCLLGFGREAHSGSLSRWHQSMGFGPVRLN